MKIVCIGDSLTEGDYGVFGKRGISDIHTENYPYFLSQILGAPVINYGKCGFRASDYLDYYQNGNAPVGDADTVIVMLGTNGGMDAENDVPENGAYRQLLSRIHDDAPQAKIILCTPPHATEDPKWSNCGYAPQVKQAVRFVRALCKAENYPLIDLAACTDFTAENEAVMQPNDGLHYGETGYRVMAQFIADRLKEI